MRNDCNKNISRSNNTRNSNSSIGSTNNRRSNNSRSNSGITGILVKLPICSSERDATLAFSYKKKCMRICRNLTFAVARVTDEGRARLARQRVPDLLV